MDVKIKFNRIFRLIIILLVWHKTNICSYAQPALGTTSFTTASNVTLVASTPCTGGQSATTSGFLFTVYSAVNCAITNATGGGSDGHINLITSPTVTGIWQETRIASNTGSEFKLENFVFAALTTPFLSKTLDITGYRNGSPVSGATASSTVISATGIANTYTLDVSANSNFSNIDEFRITPSGPATAQGTIALMSVTISAPLPVELTQFGVKRISAESLLINWQTASESNNRGFEIERSYDANGFTSVGFVDGMGTTSSFHSYQYVLNDPNKGYYRLKQIDMDGKNSYSKVIYVDEVLQTFNITYNPDVNMLSITGDTENEFEVNLVNLLGHEIGTYKGTISQIQYAINHNLIKLEGGVYFLRIAFQEEREIMKFIKTQ